MKDQREPKLQNIRYDGGTSITTWWAKDGQMVRSSTLKPVQLPVGLEAAICGLFTGRNRRRVKSA